MQRDYNDELGTNWFSLRGGRIPSLFISTEMTYCRMPSFSGLVGFFNYQFNQDDSAVAACHTELPTGRMGVNFGSRTTASVFASVGILPLRDSIPSTASRGTGQRPGF